MCTRPDPQPGPPYSNGPRSGSLGRLRYFRRCRHPFLTKETSQPDGPRIPRTSYVYLDLDTGPRTYRGRTCTSVMRPSGERSDPPSVLSPWYGPSGTHPIRKSTCTGSLPENNRHLHHESKTSNFQKSTFFGRDKRVSGVCRENQLWKRVGVKVVDGPETSVNKNSWTEIVKVQEVHSFCLFGTVTGEDPFEDTRHPIVVEIKKWNGLSGERRSYSE